MVPFNSQAGLILQDSRQREVLLSWAENNRSDIQDFFAPGLTIGLLKVLSPIVVKYRMSCAQETKPETNYNLSMPH